MTPNNRSVDEIVAGLSDETRKALSSNWDAFSQCDWQDMSCEVDGFAERLEEAGFVIFDDVDEDDLQQPFADELGIEEGGSVWRLAPLGLEVRKAILQSEQGQPK